MTSCELRAAERASGFKDVDHRVERSTTSSRRAPICPSVTDDRGKGYNACSCRSRTLTQCPRTNTFSGAFLDRHSDLRERPEWLAQAAAQPNARFVPVWQQRNLFLPGDSTGAVLLERSDALVQATDPETRVYLGTFREFECFLIELEGDEPPVHAAGDFRELRFYGATMPADEANLLAYARALSIWRRQNRYCGACGARTRSTRGGPRTCL